MLYRTANLTQLGEFDEIIDVRTPAEYDEDHVPGAINCPVLSNEERVTVGTLYTQVSPFEARKVGAALIARNIAGHLETKFHAYPKSWRPLIYCWRGGQRSGAMSIILAQVGWAAHKLEGGYKTYRRNVLSQLETLPRQFSFSVVCGPTGSAKSRLLSELMNVGKQVLDLELLARHRGSVLGGLPQQSQPSQKWFDSILLQAMQNLDPGKSVFVEAESSKIGLITLPAALIAEMHNSPCLILDASMDARVDGLMRDYRHYIDNPELLIGHLQSLHRFHGAARLEHWKSLIRNHNYAEFVRELLELHYDPSYFRATTRHFKRLDSAKRVILPDLSEETVGRIALEL
jgi:tRNA 2-selenouridine synthase